MKQFVLSEKKILIYGAGSMGLKMLRQKDLSIEGFIDRRGNEIKEFNGYRVFSPKDVKDFSNKESWCIIIVVRDVFTHSEIAMDFFNAGFNNIIFKPHSVLNGKSNVSAELLEISNAYDSLTVQDKEIIQDIPCYEGEVLFDFENSSIINEKFGSDIDSDMVRFYAPAELLFSNDLYDDTNLWTKCNFTANYIAVDLYRALQENSKDKQKEFDRYVDLYAIHGAIRAGVDVSGSWKNTVIETRLSAFYEMKLRLATDKNFFIKHCTTISLLEPCRLQLVKSGKSRVSFMTALRLSYIPALMQKKEYERYLNMDCAKKVYEYICENRITKSIVPVPHPYFYNFKADIPDYAYLWESKVARILFDLSYERSCSFDTNWLTIFDSSDDNGSISRYLKNLGFNVCRREQASNFTKLLDSLFSIKIDNLNCNKEENCLIFMNISYDDLQINKILNQIQKSTKFVFIFLRTEFVESIKKQLENSFENALLADSIANGVSYKGMYLRRKL